MDLKNCGKGGQRMKVGDLVVQRGWEDDGFGIIIKTYNTWSTGPEHKCATVQWPGGTVNMHITQLEVITSESRRHCIN